MQSWDDRGEVEVVAADRERDQLDVVRRAYSWSISAWPLLRTGVVEVDPRLEFLLFAVVKVDGRRARAGEVRAGRGRRRCRPRPTASGDSRRSSRPCALRCRSRRSSRARRRSRASLVLPAQRPASPEMYESPSETTEAVPTPGPSACATAGNAIDAIAAAIASSSCPCHRSSPFDRARERSPRRPCATRSYPDPGWVASFLERRGSGSGGGRLGRLLRRRGRGRPPPGCGSSRARRAR